MSRRAALLAGVAFIAATAGGVASPALAAGNCDGVWVVVDARTAGGPLTTRCAPGDPASGIRALTGAGHDVDYVPSQPGLVCSIDARPDSCNGAPSDAYWSYWYASEGGSWTYGNVGAGARDPAPGTVEGWRFGDGSAPPGTTPPSNDSATGGAPASAPDDSERTPEPTPASDADATDRGGDGLDASDPETLDGSAGSLVLAVTVVGAIGGATLYRRRQPSRTRREVG